MIMFTAMGVENFEVGHSGMDTVVNLRMRRICGSVDVVKSTDNVSFHFETPEVAAQFRKAMLDGGFKEYGSQPSGGT
jgi:hypothetical protein